MIPLTLVSTKFVRLACLTGFDSFIGAVFVFIEKASTYFVFIDLSSYSNLFGFRSMVLKTVSTTLTKGVGIATCK